ncbi:hypothetical protein [Saliphagus sp. LR7]|uniref:hypothetical protein n=1 Tax=Saliphagus sp. LR7 TaxID=2282654 RepID=UPI000DF75634|nr:hypothetical protein [Saliphagus sp. LR7]
MTKREKKGRAAAVCESCEAIMPVRTTPDGKIEPIGFSCNCENGDGKTLKILNEEGEHLEGYEE